MARMYPNPISPKTDSTAEPLITRPMRDLGERVAAALDAGVVGYVPGGRGRWRRMGRARREA